eukprot:TRINITY_DN87618_c0_g1_i1.p2 TRINITY_DN87618_c0_g1~~TRINITY_DN87618_c0_g1_i1.p2  ORF type:complete len:204 (-),score=40.94 TRINITY_DN87618_c0_g1_i1:21-632(-)
MSIPSVFNAVLNAQGRASMQMEATHRLVKRRMTEGSHGGFFDRQDTNDRKQWDSDDEEFDEFGRRKKRRAGASTAAKKKDREPSDPATACEASSETGNTPSSASSAKQPAAMMHNPLEDEGERVEGYIRWFEKSKHFGFLRTPGIDYDIYFKDQDRTLGAVEGMKVTFVLKQMPDGKLQARRIIPGRLSSLQIPPAQAPACTS